MNKLEKIRSIIRPGDVINSEGKCTWKRPFSCFVGKIIQFYQKNLFGSEADFNSTHSTIYFADDMVFSTTTPRTHWEYLEARLNTRFKIYRYVPLQYTDKHIDIMFKTAQSMIDLPYDIGDLFDIMVSQILGYNHVRGINWFEFSQRYTVCSTAVRTIQEKLRKTLENEGDFSIPRLFNELNPEKWDEKDRKKFTQTDVEMTTPAHYANSDYFSGEFKLISHWQEF